LYFGRDGNGLGSTTLSVDGGSLLENDLATFRPLASRLPVWFEIETAITGSNNVRMSCTDELGETGDAALSLVP
jgi:hypothetical protein